MMTRSFALIALSVVLFSGDAIAQTPPVELTVQEIMARADSVSQYQDSLLARTKYRVREESVFSELKDKGEIKNSDTAVVILTMMGNSEISREIEYSTRKAEGEKKEKSQEIGFKFSYSDTSYNFSLTETNDSSYIIAVSPKGSPREGQARGIIAIDRQSFFVRRLELEVPKPEGALKEFSTEIGFEPLEGGLVVLKEMKMRGFAKAFLGIFKVRFTGYIRHSDYEILQ
jgi:outer membrane lipoprotein-sorting protein